MQVISADEIEFHPQSYGTHQIRVFLWNGKIFRGVSPELSPPVRQLFTDGVIQKIIDKNLFVHTEIAPFQVKGYELVLEHRVVPFVSYPVEWCPAMSKDAAVMLLELAINLAESGYLLGDAHPWNILFDSYKPLFVDFGSILDLGTSIYSKHWPAYWQFLDFFLYPMLLRAYGRSEAAKLLVYGAQGVTRSDLLGLVSQKSIVSKQIKPFLALQRLTEPNFLKRVIPPNYRAVIKHYLKAISGFLRDQNTSPISQDSHTKIENANYQIQLLIFLKNLKNSVIALNLPSSASGLSSDYEQQDYPSYLLENIGTWTVKQNLIYQSLTRIKPKSVLDVGCGNGWYSKLAANMKIQVVSIDKDEQCITQLYHDARTHQLSILPLALDFVEPTPERGLCGHWSFAATNRLQCDLVLAVDVIRSIVLRGDIAFEHFVEGLFLFSKQWVIVEFVPPDHSDFEARWAKRLAWYNLEGFTKVLNRRFSEVTIISDAIDTNPLLLCKK